MTLREYLDYVSMPAVALARKAGISKGGLYNYLEGKSRPMRHIATKLVKATDNKVTLQDLGYDH